MMQTQSVKFRLTLWYALILTVLLSTFAFFMHAEFRRVLYRDVDKNLSLQAKSIQESMQSYLQGVFRGVQIAEEKRYPHFSFFYTPEVKIRLEELIRDWSEASDHLKKSTNLVRFVGVDHSELINNLRGWERDVIFPDFERNSLFMEREETYQTIYYQGKPIRLYYRLVKHQGRPLFVIQTGIPIAEVILALKRLAFVILISIPGAVIAACIAGWFLVRRSFRPIDSMSRKAREISAAYLDERLPRTKTGDELDRLAETLNEMMDRLELSTRAIQDFSSDISHELKTPLAIIRGEIDLAVRRERSPEDLKKTLNVIGEEVNGLIRLVDDLMLLVRSDAQQLKFEMKVLSLQEVVSYVFSRFQDRSIEKGIHPILDIQQDVAVLGDSVYLKRLFSNLMDNAIKFTPKNGNITVRLQRQTHNAVVTVADTGSGIQAEVQTKVFSRFYRTDQARSQDGAGLGLNIVKAICTAHDGTVEIQPNISKGTIVRVVLPAHTP